MASPFASWAQAQTAASPGDTIYFRGGTYKYAATTSTCSSPNATIHAVVLSKSGASGNPIKYWAYPGEKPVFDFSGITDATKYSCRQVGVLVAANWLHLKGLELTGALQINNLNHESWCVYVAGGSNNIFELLDAHHNMGPGFFLEHGSNNTFLNCDSHENEDTLTSNGDGQSADGFGCHPKIAGDTGNLFHGCRAWWNSDDAWDLINSREACTVEYSWAWYQGYKPDAVNAGQPVPLPAGNGNGFKGGGYGNPQTNVPSPTPQHNIWFNAAFYNKANGLYANHEIVSPFFYNNTSFNNGTDVNMLGLNGTTVTSVGILRNNIAYSNDRHALISNMTNGGPISDQFNSWDATLNLTVTDADFQSVAFAPPAGCPAPFAPGGTPCCKPTDMTCFAGMASARQPDGSLPVLPFLRLATTSALIAKGANVGFPYSGKAPDLGCFDTGLPYGGGDGGVTLGDSGLSDASGSSGGSGSSGSSGGSGSDGSLPGASEGGTPWPGGGSGNSGSSGAAPSGGSGSLGRLDAGASGGGPGFGSTPPSGKGGCGCTLIGRDGSGHPWLALGVLGLIWKRGPLLRRRQGAVP